MQGLRHLFGSVSFRLALNYGVLAMFTMLVVIAVFHVQTVGVLKQASARQVTVTAQRMTHQYERGGRPAVLEAMRQMLEDGTDTDTELYQLLDEGGRMLAGNFTGSIGTEPAYRPVERDIVHAGRPSRALLMSLPLSDGSSLVVGNEMSDQRRVEALVQRAIAAAASVALLLVLLGTWWFRSSLDARVEAIRRTTRHVGAGDLTSRVPAAGQEDEFALLDRDINQMLDRIEGLMDGVKHLSNTIAHEMRTPMARVLAQLLNAQRSGSTEAQAREANRVAIRELEALTTIFDKLLQIAEAESGTRRQSFQPVDFDPIIGDVVELFGAVAEEQGARLAGQCGPEVRVMGDRDLLAGVVANLVENALKHAGPGTQVRVAAAREADSVSIRVDDNGRGVPPAVLGRLGTRFYRLDSRTPGFGLGLATVRAIVHLHGGSLGFADAAPGLSVRIRLPAATG